MSIILGADSRYTTSIPADTEYQFFGIKVSDGIAGGPYSQPMTQWRLAGDLNKARLPFHFWRGPGTTDPVQDGTDQAQWFHQTYLDHFGDAELPPCIDVEDPYSIKGLHALDSVVACLQHTEDLWGIPRYSALLYSAGWWWDTRIKPYTTASHEIYRWKIWEADPPPETPIGYWQIADSVVTQRKLDFIKAGFNAKIDEDIADATWYLSWVNGSPPSPSPTGGVDRDKVLEAIGLLQEAVA